MPAFVRLFACAALSAAALVTGVASPASAVVPSAPAALPIGIEPMPPYQPQTFCDPVAKRGTKELAALLTSTYQGTAIVSLTRACGSDTSEHYDGRAIDWGVNVANDKQRAQGKAFLHWLFAADAAGNPNAMLRRLGVMYVIWNKRIWGGWSHQWEPYSCSGVTACHQDHMHLSLDWSGALGRTSFWTGKVSEPMPPPLQLLKSTTATPTVTIDARRPTPDAQYKVVAGARYRFTVTGTYNYDGAHHHRADSECSTTDATTWSPLAPGETSARSGQLDLWINGHRTWRPVDAADGCSPTHSYQQSITFPDKAPLLFSIDDPGQWGASGSLKVTVQRVS
jgi:hypothetical protein